jgi:hypothetical protein
MASILAPSASRDEPRPTCQIIMVLDLLPHIGSRHRSDELLTLGLVVFHDEQAARRKQFGSSPDEEQR